MDGVGNGRHGSERDSAHVNRIFQILSNERRRYVLHYLTRFENSAELHEVIDFMIEMDPDIEPEDRESMAVEWYHNHLPKLRNARIIEYDERSETIRLSECSLLKACLGHVVERDL